MRKMFVLSIFLLNFGANGADSRLLAERFTNKNMPLYLVRESVKASYGYRFSSYLKYLTPEEQRDLKFIMITPKGLQIVKRIENPVELPRIAPDRAVKICDLLVNRSPIFKARLQRWRKARWITEPDLARLAMQLRPGKRPACDE